MAALTDQPAPEPRAPLSRERVLRAAMELADEAGLDALSMRRLAQRLGVEAMSLYHHVRNKDDLLAGMLDAVYAEIELPAGTGEWQEEMRRTAISFHDALLRHEWACGLFMAPLSVGPARFRYMDGVLGRLRGAGFSAVMTHHAYHVLDSHIVGFVLWLLPYLGFLRQSPEAANDVLRSVPLEGLPHLAEHVVVHQAPERADDVSEFEFGLNLLLDGFDKLRDGG
jgi:AcrR family transcriptional regulator